MSKTSLVAMFFGTILILADAGCQKSTFETDSTYAEEIQNFILRDRDGKELFKPIYISESKFLYGLSQDTSFYRFDSTKRRIYVTISDSARDIYPYTGIYDALARVQDVMWGNMYRVKGIDTIRAYRVLDTLTRYGYFLKLYDDNYQYRGWRFKGFIGGYYQPYIAPEERTISGSNGPKSPAIAPAAAPPDLHSTYGYYIRDDSIPKYPLGDSVTLTSTARDLIFTENGDTLLAPLNALPSNSHYSVKWRIPTNSNTLYHLILFDIKGRFTVKNNVDSTLIKVNDYFIPYKVDI
jgi:hypothetical protein